MYSNIFRWQPFSNKSQMNSWLRHILLTGLILLSFIDGTTLAEIEPSVQLTKKALIAAPTGGQTPAKNETEQARRAASNFSAPGTRFEVFRWQRN